MFRCLVIRSSGACGLRHTALLQSTHLPLPFTWAHTIPSHHHPCLHQIKPALPTPCLCPTVGPVGDRNLPAPMKSPNIIPTFNLPYPKGGWLCVGVVA